MTALYLVVFILIAVLVGGAVLLAPRSKIAAGGIATLSLPVIGFSIFGFLASFEPLPTHEDQIAKVLFVGLFSGAVFSLFHSGRRLLARS